jgi:hypothetical protein
MRLTSLAIKSIWSIVSRHGCLLPYLLSLPNQSQTMSAKITWGERLRPWWWCRPRRTQWVAGACIANWQTPVPYYNLQIYLWFIVMIYLSISLALYFLPNERVQVGDDLWGAFHGLLVRRCVRRHIITINNNKNYKNKNYNNKNNLVAGNYRPWWRRWQRSAPASARSSCWTSCSPRYTWRKK